MAIKITPLTDTQIKSLKPQKKNKKYFDGGGLFLLVTPNGGKLWQMKYKRPISNKETLLSFGRYPETSLQQARKMRDDARELIKQGIDPQQNKAEQEQKKQAELDNTFHALALKWFDFKTEKGLEELTLKKSWRSLELHFFPYIKDVPISQITAIQAINTLQPLSKNNKLETVKRVCRRVNEVMYYAVNMGIIDNNPLARDNDPINYSATTVNRWRICLADSASSIIAIA